MTAPQFRQDSISRLSISSPQVVQRIFPIEGSFLRRCYKIRALPLVSAGKGFIIHSLPFVKKTKVWYTFIIITF